MSLRREMLQVARLARRQLHDSADLIVDFALGRLNLDGGFRGRKEKSDLYYTVFGLECLAALAADIPAASVGTYLRSFGDGESLDFVHLACLARSWATMPDDLLQEVPRERILARIEAYRSKDGGYDPSGGQGHGTVYGCFLALGAYQDLGLEIPARSQMRDCLAALETKDGGFANQPGAPVGLTPATAAAVTLLRHLGEIPRPELSRWLMNRSHRQGGFSASPAAPIPDLLSTATALHALSGLRAAIDPIREISLDFIDSLWTNRGGFYGHWEDTELDCEYTYYGLLALGHLSL